MAHNPPLEKLSNLTLRVPGDVLETADKLAKKLSAGWYNVTRADVLRRALLVGLASLEKDK